MEKTTVGLIVGNRGFFPDHLCREGRDRMLKVLREEGFGVVTLPLKATKFGSVETREDALACAALFRKEAEAIQGVVVTLPNFGDERAVAETLRAARLGVPVLIHAFPDDPGRMDIQHRRDAFCGKISICNNLVQYGIPFTLTGRHTVAPESDAFREDLRAFGACCRVVRGLRGARIGALGARPAAFNTVRYSEKLLEEAGITVVTLDLYELFGRVERLKNTAPEVKRKRTAIRHYVNTAGVPAPALDRMARFGAALDRWIAEEGLAATAVQCWTALEEYFGIVPCTVMSMLSDALTPSACEVDVAGAVAMLALRLASGLPAALLDWNNDFGEDPELCVVFHCSNLPVSLLRERRMDYQAIIAGTVGKENAWGTCTGCLKPGPMTFLRVSTDEFTGTLRAYAGEGEILEEAPATFGGYGAARIPDLQGLLRYVCEEGFEHHVAATPGRYARGITEALAKYLNFHVYRHPGARGPTR